MKKLDEFGIYRGTDKSSLIHNYCVKYERHFPFNRSDNLKLLEIGVKDGESLRMWKDYYFNSQIIGIDINKKCLEHQENRIKIEIGSQNDVEFLNFLIEKYGPFDIILDDGSHMNEDVIKTFENLFSSLNSGGIYVIEDSCTSYWYDYHGGLGKKETIMEYFKNLTDHVNFFGIINFNEKIVHSRRELALLEFSKKEQPMCRVDIESINFLNSIIILTKR